MQNTSFTWHEKILGHVRILPMWQGGLTQKLCQYLDLQCLCIPVFALNSPSLKIKSLLEVTELTLSILQGPSILTSQFYTNTMAIQTTLTCTANNQNVLQRNRGWEAQRTSADLLQPALPIE